MPRTRSVRRLVNTSLRRATGYELQRPRPDGKAAEDKPAIPLAPTPPEQRLVTAPVFILSSVRSGSTLLRMLLGSHSQLHAPHELHLSNIEVRLRSTNTHKAMAAVGLDEQRLEQLLWDRLLDRQLRASGKRTIVNKTPSDAFIWPRIAETWPDARFIFLVRHPMSVVHSRHDSHPEEPLERSVRFTKRFMEAVEEARQALPGPTVRYEDLTADPAAVLQELCSFLDVPWEESMLDYRERAGDDFKRGLGDWSERIRSGTVQPARPLPSADEVPEELHELCRAWGYALGGADGDGTARPVPAPASRPRPAPLTPSTGGAAGTAPGVPTDGAPEARAKPPAAPKFPADFDEEAREIITAVQPWTMTSPEKLFGLISATRYITRHGIPGDIVECGVWRGGSMQAAARTLLSAGDTSRHLYLFDTYEGMPPPGAEDVRHDGSPAEELLATSDRDSKVWAVATLDDVVSGFEAVPYPSDKVHFVKGMVEDTVPAEAPDQISILRLDTDWYESTRHELQHLYGRLVSGGVLIIDDYGYWKGSTRAVDEFIDATGERLLLLRASSGRIAVKP